MLYDLALQTTIAATLAVLGLIYVVPLLRGEVNRD